MKQISRQKLDILPIAKVLDEKLPKKIGIS